MNDSKHGYGIYRWAEGGGIYSGEWKQDNKEGHAFYRFANGDSYLAQFKNNMKI